MCCGCADVIAKMDIGRRKEKVEEERAPRAEIQDLSMMLHMQALAPLKLKSGFYILDGTLSQNILGIDNKSAQGCCDV